MRRSTGAASGLTILILGVWGALIPFVGPYFNFSYSPDKTWHWSTGRLWLDVIPGVVAAIAGFMLMGAGRRGRAGLAAWLALCAGVWFVCGPIVSELWNHGVAQTGVPLHARATRVLEQLAFYQGIGVAIAALAGIALGRLVPYRAVPMEPGPAGPATTAGDGETANETAVVSPERRATPG
ncbi:MAG TPA: hypothetical protein VGI54_09610 [Solirubrobacteraceae bacterium]|jgi:hypothetical protein